MPDDPKESLLSLCIDLLLAPKKYQHPWIYLDNTAILLLKIIRLLINKNDIINDIAITLSLMLNKYDPKDYQKQLSTSLMFCAKHNSKKYQGFNSLMSLALEDMELQKSPQLLLKHINIKHDIKQRIILLYDILKIAENLANYYRINRHVKALLFVFGLAHILAVIGSNKILSILEWLKLRVNHSFIHEAYPQLLKPINHQHHPSIIMAQIIIIIAKDGVIFQEKKCLLSLAPLAIGNITSLVDNDLLILAKNCYNKFAMDM